MVGENKYMLALTRTESEQAVACRRYIVWIRINEFTTKKIAPCHTSCFQKEVYSQGKIIHRLTSFLSNDWNLHPTFTIGIECAN